MTITKTYGTFYLCCDHCDEEEDTCCDDFYDAVDFKKTDDGWRSFKEDGEWVDLCIDCFCKIKK